MYVLWLTECRTFGIRIRLENVQNLFQILFSKAGENQRQKKALNMTSVWKQQQKNKQTTYQICNLISQKLVLYNSQYHNVATYVFIPANRSRRRLRKPGQGGTWPLSLRVWWSAAVLITAQWLSASTTTAPAVSLTWQEVVHPPAPTCLFQVEFQGALVPLWSAHMSPSQVTLSIPQTHQFLKNPRTVDPREWTIFL